MPSSLGMIFQGVPNNIVSTVNVDVLRERRLLSRYSKRDRRIRTMLVWVLFLSRFRWLFWFWVELRGGDWVEWVEFWFWRLFSLLGSIRDSIFVIHSTMTTTKPKNKWTASTQQLNSHHREKLSTTQATSRSIPLVGRMKNAKRLAQCSVLGLALIGLLSLVLAPRNPLHTPDHERCCPRSFPSSRCFQKHSSKISRKNMFHVSLQIIILQIYCHQCGHVRHRKDNTIREQPPILPLLPTIHSFLRTLQWPEFLITGEQQYGSRSNATNSAQFIKSKWLSFTGGDCRTNEWKLGAFTICYRPWFGANSFFLFELYGMKRQEDVKGAREM